MKKNIFVDCNVDDLHKVQTDILKEFKRVCDKNDLRYYLCYGTCLGAVRHKGFVPWDSDIDVFMYIDDIDKLMKLQSQFGDRYFIQSQETDPEYESTCVRIRRSDTTFIIEEEGLENDINHGIWIDVHPLYYCPESRKKQLLYSYMAFFNRLMIANRIPLNHGGIVKMISKLILTVIPDFMKKKISRFIDNRLRSNKNTKEVFHFFSASLKDPLSGVCKAKWFRKPKQLEFEGEMFSGPTCPDMYLKKTYGNYMQLPPVEERVVKFEGAFIDTNNSYKKYKGKRYCIKRKKQKHL